MEVMLAIAVIAVGASGLYVSATFASRMRRTASPMIDGAVGTLSEAIQAYHAEHERQFQDARRQLQELSDLLTAELERIDKDLGQMRSLLDSAEQSTAASLGRLKAEFSSVMRPTDDLTARSEQALREAQLARQRTSELSESLSGRLDHERQLDDRLHHAETLISELDGNLQAAMGGASLRQAHLEERLAATSRALDDCASVNDDRWHSNLWVTDQLLDLVKHVEAILRDQHDIHAFLSSRLDQETLLTIDNPTCRVITASVCLRAPAADLIWPLVGSFCDALTLTPLLSAPPTLTARSSYALWKPQDDRALEDVLGDQLSALPGPASTPATGLTELRNLATALHVSGPGSVRIGPMIITRTTAALRGVVMTATEASRIGGGGPASPEAYEEQLRQLDQDRVTELTSWANALTS